ncbi:MAG: thioredoxin family protein, partial [Planctomycetes bacterium]|nr:thioredoxin family protein [Planctomycetota bacterium]
MTAFPRLVLGVCWVAGTVASLAAQGDQKRLVELRDAKLAAPFLAKGAWSTDYDAVRVKAAKSGKPILIYFTRSYAPCPSCAILEQGLLAEPAFLGATSSVERFCHVTSLVAQDRFQRLLTDLGGRSFPYFAVVDAEGKPIARFDEQPTLANFKKLLAGEVAEYVALRDRAAKGDKAAKAEFLIRRITLGHLTPAEIEVALRKADYLDAAQRARIRGGLVNLEIAAIFGQIDESNPKSYGTAVSRLLAMKRGNRIPTGQIERSCTRVYFTHVRTSRRPAMASNAHAAIKK